MIISLFRVAIKFFVIIAYQIYSTPNCKTKVQFHLDISHICLTECKYASQAFIIIGRRGEVVINIAQFHSKKAGSAQVQILFVMCWRFAMLGMSDSGPGWK